MNRHSILFKLNILFAVALLAALIAGASIMLHLVKKDHADMVFKSRLIMQEYRATKQKPVTLFDEFALTEVVGDEKAKILREAHPLRNIFRKKWIRILVYKGSKYLYINRPRYSLLLKDNRTFIERFYLPLLVMFGIIAVLILMYILLRKSMAPLRSLQKDIVDYGEGKLQHYTFSEKKDEISRACNAFYDAVEKVSRLSESRQLFIRNLFHELNTPVTKGKILTEIVDDPKTKTMLDSIFGRLSLLLKELAEMERITSENYTLITKPVRIIDLIDEASDLLYLESPVKHNIASETVYADFSAMSIVFKNLIENACKYGSDPEIIYTPGRLSFVSSGEALKEALSYYTEAFTKGQKQQSSKGFGLGLYIVNEIVNKHKMEFEYKYNEGKNYFTILLKNNF